MEMGSALLSSQPPVLSIFLAFGDKVVQGLGAIVLDSSPSCHFWLHELAQVRSPP